MVELLLTANGGAGKLADQFARRAFAADTGDISHAQQTIQVKGAELTKVTCDLN